MVEGATYFYVVRSVDTSFNRSGNSPEVSARAELRTVTLTFNVTVPAPVEDAVGKSVYIAGTLNRLDGGLPEWNPAGVVLAKVDDTHWQIAVTGKEGTQLEYKYTLGFGTSSRRTGPAASAPTGSSRSRTANQVASDTVQNWRNVTPCGN